MAPINPNAKAHTRFLSRRHCSTGNPSSQPSPYSASNGSTKTANTTNLIGKRMNPTWGTISLSTPYARPCSPNATPDPDKLPTNPPPRNFSLKLFQPPQRSPPQPRLQDDLRRAYKHLHRSGECRHDHRTPPLAPGFLHHPHHPGHPAQ